MVSLDTFRQPLHKTLPIMIIPENRLAIISTAGDVVEAALDQGPGFSGHVRILTQNPWIVSRFKIQGLTPI